MHDDETLDRLPGLEEAWREQEAARTSRLPPAHPSLEASSDGGYARLYDLMAGARDLDPPAGLVVQIASAVEDHANAARQVDAFRRMVRRYVAVPIAAVVVAGAASVGIPDLIGMLSAASWLCVPALALLLGGLPARSKRPA